MKRIVNKFLVMFVLMLLIVSLKAQQLPLFNTYSYDLMQLNIAAIGRTCVEANLNYRAQWLGLKETPRLYQLNAGMALGNSSGLGVKVAQNTLGLLKFTSATLGYAYRVKINDKSKLHLGIGAAWQQNNFNANKAIVNDNNDITLSNAQNLRSNNFDCEAGALFLGDKLTAGISALHLYNTNSKFGSIGFKTTPQLNAVAAYKFNKGKTVEVEPWLVNRYTINGTNQPEAMINVRFKQMITLGGGYRLNYGYLAMAGFELNVLKLAYSFDYGVGKNAASLGASHQILIGVDLCRKKAKTPEPVVETPAPEPKPEPIVVKEEPKSEPIIVKEEPKVETPSTPIVDKDAEAKKAIRDINLLCESLVFDLNQSTLGEDKKANLDKMADIIKANNLNLKITGFACNKGNEEYNKLLSHKRAEYVKGELHKRGISNSKLETFGIGEEKELFDNNTSLQPKNRTVRISL
jgi:type IX secretion system PorP/SprF family membrane protein